MTRSLWPLARAAAAAAADLLLPRACVACGRAIARGEPGVVCGRCWVRVIPLSAPQCARCGHPGVRDRCRWCDLLPPYVRAVRSVCWMPDGTAGDIVHALKYDGWRDVAEGMAARMARLAWPHDVVDERRALIPVPLSRRRERERGYNQSDLLACALARRWGVSAWRDVLARTRDTRTQTRLTPGDRLTNVAGAFRVLDGADRLRGAHVVLVDDVVTTAATLNACAAALLRGGARIISYVTYGRARAAGDQPF